MNRSQIKFAHSLSGWRLLVAGLLCVASIVQAQQTTRAEALAIEKAGPIADAEQRWRAVAEINPADPEPLAHLGLLEARQEHYEAAIGFYRQALQLNPEFPGV